MSLEQSYGFYCDLEEESTYIYEVIECGNCHKVVRIDKNNTQDLSQQLAEIPLREDPKITRIANIYISVVFVILTVYLFFV